MIFGNYVLEGKMISELKDVLEGKMISRRNVSDKVFISKLSMIQSDVRIPFKFERRQFPLAVSFSMTNNKSKKQSLKHVELYLPTFVFLHGQLNFPISRVKDINL